MIYFIIYVMVQIKTTHVSKSNMDGAARQGSSVVCAFSFYCVLLCFDALRSVAHAAKHAYQLGKSFRENGRKLGVWVGG